MTGSLSTLYRDYLNNEHLCCFLCDENGVIRHVGCGLLMRYPHIFQKGRTFTEYYAAEEQLQQIKEELSQTGYSVTPAFQMFGSTFLLCMFGVKDPETKKQYILCKLEEIASASNDSHTIHFKEQLIEKNNALLAQIAESCQNLSKPGMAEHAKTCSEALQRNYLLLHMLERTVLSVPSNRGVLPGQVCTAMQKQLQLAQDALPLKTAFRITASEKRYYLNTEQMIEMLFSVISLYAIGDSVSNLYLTLTETKGEFCLQALASAGKTDDNKQLLQNCFCAIIRRFAEQYGGNAAFLNNDHALSVRVTFSPAVDDAAAESAYFEQDHSDFSAINRLLPLLRYAAR